MCRYAEVMDVWSCAIVVNVIDRDSLLFLTTQHDSLAPRVLQNGIKHLSITLLLPLDFFLSLETDQSLLTAQCWHQICCAPLFQMSEHAAPLVRPHRH